MPFFNRLTAVLVALAMLAPALPLEAKTRKGDKYLSDGRVHEAKKEWDAALEDYEKALSEDPAEMVYQMATEKARFQAGQVHIDKGLKLRAQGQLGEALLEFQKAYAINPSSAIAVQETQLTRDMIERERKRVEATGKVDPPAVRALTPLEEYKKNERDKLDRILSVPELKPLDPKHINLKMNNKTKVLFETVAAYAGINVLWDPEFQPPPKDGFNIQLEDATIEQALDYLAVLTKSYWKPISPNTIFITMDNPNKRRDYEEWVTKTFYLQNVQSQQELQEIVNAVRTITDISKIYQFLGQNALVVRGESDKVELAEKIIRDLDKPKSEVVVDVMVIEASSVFSRQITAALASTGLNVPVNFNPRQSIQVQSTTNNNTSTTGTNTNSSTTQNLSNTTTASSTTGTFIPLNQLGHLSSADFATTLPGALLQAAMSDAKTKVLQSPQLRSVDNAKAILKIGEREPTATGSFQPGIGGVGINPLVNTQFTYIDVGVNVELTPRVHDNGEVSMHIKLDISNVAGQVNLGGIQQPIIGQRAVEHDIRMREGEVGLLGGLINTENDKTVTGIPGLRSIPLLGKLFSGESTNENRDELMIVLIPHIIRRPEISAENVRPVASGTQLTVKLSHEPAPADVKPAEGTTPSGSPIAPSSTPANPKPALPAAENNPIVAPGGPALPATAPPLPASAAPPATGGGAPQAQGPARVHFQPSQVDTDMGSSITVSLVVDGGTDVASAPMIVTWDPKVLSLNSVNQGDLLARGGQQPVFNKNVQNDQGRASVQIGVMPNSPGVTAPTGALVTFTFQAVGRGATQVTIPQLNVRNSQGGTVVAGSPQLTVNVK
ncbi:MAG TPA: cohesin domain-containing protein [Bryobacteraceae bacterium]|nr:cohesin domain-containing protein [Bryobacteraceae bacterium]